jgi:hypothetical protein
MRVEKSRKASCEVSKITGGRGRSSTRIRSVLKQQQQQTCSFVSSRVYVPWIEPGWMRTTEVRDHGTKRRRSCRRDSRRPSRIEMGQDFERQILTQWMNGNDHVGPLTRTTNGSRQTLFKAIKAKRGDQEFIQPHAERRGTKVIENVPRDGIFRHELVHVDVVIVRPEWTIVGENVHNIHDKLVGM